MLQIDGLPKREILYSLNWDVVIALCQYLRNTDPYADLMKQAFFVACAHVVNHLNPLLISEFTLVELQC